MMKRLKITYAISVFFVSLMVFASPAFASPSGGIGLRPANPDPSNPRSLNIFIYEMNPGETKEDEAFINNGTDNGEIVFLTAVDVTAGNNGSVECRQNSEDKKGVGSWIKLSETEANLPADTNKNVKFTIKVPANADVGEHTGCLTIQKKKDPGIPAGGGAIVQTRQAARVSIIVPGDINREITTSDFKVNNTEVTTGDGKKNPGQNYSFKIKNKGNVSADVGYEITINNMFFGEKGYVLSGQQAVMRDANLQINNFEKSFTPFFGGWYKATLVASYDKRAGTFGLADKSQIIRTDPLEVVVFVWPSIWFWVCLVAIILSVGSFIINKKTSKRPSKKKKSDQTMWGVYVVKSGDNLDDLAFQHGVSVSKIATLNNIKSPYKLTPGQKIYLPRK